MVNKSQIKDPRSWNRWINAGAVEELVGYEPAALQANVNTSEGDQLHHWYLVILRDDQKLRVRAERIDGPHIADFVKKQGLTRIHTYDPDIVNQLGIADYVTVVEPDRSRKFPYFGELETGPRAIYKTVTPEAPLTRVDLEQQGGMYIETKERYDGPLSLVKPKNLPNPWANSIFRKVNNSQVEEETGIKLEVNYNTVISEVDERNGAGRLFEAGHEFRTARVHVNNSGDVFEFYRARNDEVGTGHYYGGLIYQARFTMRGLEDLTALPGEHIVISPFRNAGQIRVRVYPYQSSE